MNKSKQKAASLTPSIIAKKGTAAPSVATPDVDGATKTAEQTPSENKSANKRIAITVKVLESPYLRMKTYGAANRKSNQDILEDALESYLNKVDA